MAAYSFGQLESLWINAGGSKALAPVMAAIALAESSGNPNAKNASGASGLWQVMVPVNSGYVPGGAGNVFNPQANAVAAVKIEKSQGLGAWTTYTSGAYKKFLPSGGGGSSLLGDTLQNILGPIADLAPVESGASSVAGAASGAATAAGNAAGSVSDATSTIANAVSWIFNAKHIMDIFKAIGGAVLIFLALKSLTGVQTPEIIKEAPLAAAAAA